MLLNADDSNWPLNYQFNKITVTEFIKAARSSSFAYSESVI